MKKKVKVYNRFASPLRYPGSKARLSDYIANSLRINNLQPELFIEPFCGGGSVAIALLEADMVDAIALADKDPLIASFWRVVFSDDAKWLANRILSIEISVEKWTKLKKSKPVNIREQALKCLYLNRTSFSGILHESAGPIGGRTQEKRDIGCRFFRERLAQRVLELSKLKKRVKFVACQNYLTVYQRVTRNVIKGSLPGNIFWYFDPPFYHKAEKLYRHYFKPEEHLAFKNWISCLTDPWILSYDDSIEIRQIYKKHSGYGQLAEMVYSASKTGGNSVIGRELLFSNLPELPASGGMHTSRSIRGFIVFSGKQDLSPSAIETMGPMRRSIAECNAK